MKTAVATRTMLPLVPLGHSGLLVSRLGLGLAGVGRPAYMAPGRDADLGADRSVAAMRRRCHGLLDLAWHTGVRYVDAARSYGLAEQFLNAWWDNRQLPDSALTVGSKWGYIYTGSWRLDAAVHETKQLTVETLRRQSIESSVTLGPRLSLYQIHSATVESGVLEDRAILAELGRLRARGLHIGVTVTGPRQADTIRRALAVRVDGVPLIETVQATWNVLEPSAGEALREARASGRGVIVKEVLANGRLTERHGGGLREMRDRAVELNTSLESLAFAAALAQPWCDVVLSGAVTVEHLEAHLAAFDLPADVGRFEGLAEPPQAYWAARETLPWN